MGDDLCVVTCLGLVITGFHEYTGLPRDGNQTTGVDHNLTFAPFSSSFRSGTAQVWPTSDLISPDLVILAYIRPIWPDWSNISPILPDLAKIGKTSDFAKCGPMCSTSGQIRPNLA